MSFYGGRPGKSFSIHKVFKHYPELYQDAIDSNIQGTNIGLLAVPENAFVLINYGADSAEIEENRNFENTWFSLNPNLKPDIVLNAENQSNYNSTIWLKRYSQEKGFYYSYIANIGVIFPHISNTTGNWILPTGTAAGDYDTGIQAQAREIEFEFEENIVYQNTWFKKETDNGIIYALANLRDKYIENTLTNSFDSHPEGTYFKFYEANDKGEYVYENGQVKELGYFELDNWVEIETINSVNFPVDKLKWRFNDSYDELGNKVWTDLFDVTGIVSLEEYRQDALNASQSAQEYFHQVEDISKDIEEKKEEIDSISETLGQEIDVIKADVEVVQQIAKSAKASVQILEELLKDESIQDTPGTYAWTKILEATGEEFKGGNLKSRLDLMPYQFDTISLMQKSSNLKRGDKAFTFGMDNIGDGDSSKLFQIFDETNEEDKKRLEEVIEGSITTDNPEGEKVIKESYPLANGLIAGLLTIFSGYGSGGGGGSAVPSLTVTGSEFTLQEGEIIDIDYYWTGPNAGVATLFVTDSNKNSPKVVDYYDPSKVYSSGVQLTGFGAGKISLKPIKGEHNYTIYIIDRAQAYSNEAKVKVTVGGVSLTVNYPDGKSFTANQAITYNYTVNTIYAKPSVLEYTLYKGNEIFKEGIVTSTSNAAGSQFIPLTIKTSTQNIGQGEFRLVARAYVEGNESISTPQITRNFVIMENNVIYLTTSFDGESTPLQQDTVAYIPFELIYVGGSNFIVEGRYSEKEGFNWEEGNIIPPGDFPKPDAAGSFNYTVIMPNIGTYYFRFRVSSSIDSYISGESREIKVNVIEKISKYQLRKEDAIQVHYSARRGQTNEANKYTWKNISTQTQGYDASLVNFNYLSNGWETKEIETESGTIIQPTGYLSCNSKTYVASNYPFFSNITATEGGSFEFVFKAADIGKNQTILAMEYAPGSGFYIYKDKAVFNSSLWGVNDLTAYYNIDGVAENSKPIHITLTIDPKDKYIKIYVNGVLSRASATMIFNKNNNGTTTYINRQVTGEDPQYSVTKIDCLRFYSTALTSYDVLCNYQYNLRDEQEQVAFGNKNFLDSESEDTVPSEIPYMTFYLTKTQWQTMDKDNVKPKIKVTYHDPNPAEGNETDYEWNGVTTSWQGTSSIAYPVKNFKIKLPKKYKLKGEKSLEEKTFCLKADYMDSSHCHNTGNVNFIHQTGLLSNYSLTPAQSKELNISVKEGYQGLNNLDLDIRPGDLKTRTTIDGYPISLYICVETDESAEKENNDNKEYEAPIFWGIYNFNLDKGSTDSFGLTRDADDFQNVASFEIAANSAYDGGGFRAMRFVRNVTTNEYGWTKWNVGYNDDASIDLINGLNLQINLAESSGEIKTEVRTIDILEDLINYKGIYNKNRDLKGIFAPAFRYNSTGEESTSGTYIKLFKLDDKNDTFAYDEDGFKIVEGYYEYNANEWSDDVPKDSVILSPKILWEIAENPEIQDFKYQYYENDFELRFPDSDIFLTKDKKKNKLYYKEYDKLIALVEWVDSIDPNFNFKNEFAEHFDTNTVLNYYLMLMVVGLIDNFGKNLMIDTWGYNKDGEIPYLTYLKDNKIYHKVWKYNYDHDTIAYGLMDMEINSNGLYNVYLSNEKYDELKEFIEEAPFTEFGEDGEMVGWYHETDINQYVWYPHFYDLDSCLGVNNSGLLSFSPSIEMEDKFYINYEGNEVPNAPFNTSSSALWQQFVKNYSDELKARYLELTENQIFTTNTFSKYYYSDIVDKMGPRMYNNDAYPKYLSREEIKVIVAGQVSTRVPYSFDHLALGHDWQRIKTWLDKRLTYLYTMFKRNDTDDYGTGFELRSETEKTYNFKLECYDPMYMKVIYKNNNSKPFRLTSSNGIIEFSVAAGGATDQEIYFVPGYNVKYIKEVSSPQQGFSSAKLDNGTRLLELDLANSEGLTNIEYERPSGNLIRKMNFENCPVFKATIAADNYPYLEYINTLGTQATFTFSPKGGILEEAYLEASDILNVENYADLKNLTIQLTYSENPTYAELPLKHNANYSTASFINCSNKLFNLNFKGRYFNHATQSYSEVDLTKFIKQYGKLSLFPTLTNVVLKNSTIDGGVYIKQLQPNGKVLNVKELKLALPLLERLEVINGDDPNNIKYDKIAFIQAGRNINGITKFVGFPGWGQSPEIDSANYGTGDEIFITGKVEGIIGDKYIEELEFRAPYEDTVFPEVSLPPAGEKFEFPWRTYLGHLPGLKRLKFNAKSITAKNMSYSADIEKGDKYYFTKPLDVTSDSWYPNRFELILPSAKDENGLELIYFSPDASKIDFTCIRQQNTNKGEYGQYINRNFIFPNNWPNEAKNYFEEIISGGGEIGKATFNVFKGIDLRGYSNLAMNFKGLTKIKGILGMNALNVMSIDSYFNKENQGAFQNYFNNCESLESFFTSILISSETKDTPAIYDYSKWNFNPWFNNYSIYFKDISYFFANCKNLKSDYLSGVLQQKTSNFAIEKAKYLFNNCEALTDIQLNWVDNNCLIDIEGMLSGCTSLTKADIEILNIDPNKNCIKSLKELFKNCKSLSDVRVALITADGKNSHFKNIEHLDYMFQSCEALKEIDFTIKENGINLYDFNNLVSAEYWFNNCLNLEKVKFIEEVNFEKVESLIGAFESCKMLNNIFDNSTSPKFYNPEISTSKLVLDRLFLGCENLPKIFSLNNADFTRVQSIKNILNGCKKLYGDQGILDLTNLTFGEYLDMESAFANCEIIEEIRLPIIKASAVNNLFNGCKQLANLDVSVITPVKKVDNIEYGLNNFSYLFNLCQSLTDQTFTGFENWNMEYASNLNHMFAGCSKLNTLNLSNWHMTKGTEDVNIANMFEGCVNLASINGLTNWFGDQDTVLKPTYKRRFTSTGVQNLFANCSNLNFSNIQLYLWAKMAIDLESMSKMFYNCHKLTNLNTVFMEKDDFNIRYALKWGGIENNCDFTSLTNLSEMCVGTNLTTFNYFSTENKVGYKDNTYSRPTQINKMIQNCSSLENFTFTPINVGMHNLDSMIGFFTGCSNLKTINFLGASTTEGNKGIKVAIDLSPTLKDNAFVNFISNEYSIDNWLYTFAENEAQGLSGTIKVSSKQAEVLLNNNKGLALLNRLEAKNWTIGTDSDSDITD